MGKKTKQARREGRESGWRDALLAASETRGSFFDSLDSEIADALRVDKDYVKAHDAVVERDHRFDWADYLENWLSTVIPSRDPVTVDEVIAALRAETVPFGKGETQ